MLKKLFGRKLNTVQSQAPQLTPSQNQVMQQFLGVRGLPTMPAAAQKAFEISINPRAEARDFIEVIRADEALSARVLKIANSVYFDRGHKSETVEDAVTLIGLSETRGLMNATTLNDLFPSRHPAREQFWANAIATGIIARLLARKIANEYSELAFTAGLMHDLGKLLMLQRSPDDYEKVLKLVQSNGRSFHEAEAEFFIFDHCQLGQFLANRWNFSNDLTLAIRCHHAPWSAEELKGTSKPTIAHIVKSSDIVAHALSLGHPQGYSKLQKNSESLLASAFKVLGIEPQEISSFIENAKISYQKEAELYL